MRDALMVVAVVGAIGIMFVMALAATKYGEAIDKEIEDREKRRARKSREPPDSTR